MPEINLMDKYPRSKRPIDERGSLITDEHRRVARQFGQSYYDGDRLYGYGGYSYHPRFWEETVLQFKSHYRLPEDAAILDIGCAKGFMLHDFKRLMPQCRVSGIDVSEYGIANAIDTIKAYLRVGDAAKLPFEDNSFDLVISINTIHNLPENECRKAVREIERVSRGHSFLTVDAWRNDIEKIRLMKWNLTALTYMHVDKWKHLFDAEGYSGDYYWFIAE